MEERAKDIASAFVTHVKKMARSQQTSSPESPTKIDEAMGNFSVFLKQFRNGRAQFRCALCVKLLLM